MSDTVISAPTGAGPITRTTTDTTPPAQETKGNGVPWQPLFWAAMAIAVVYVAFALLAYYRADDAGMNETIWSRSVLVLKGIEAVAFTAIGWLFGREVNRGEAQVAKEKAADAKQDADAAKEQVKTERAKADTAEAARREAREAQLVAEKDGWRLAERIRGRAEVAGGQVPPAGGEGGDERSPASPRPSGDRGLPQTSGRGSGIDDLKDLADRLFPPA